MEINFKIFVVLVRSWRGEWTRLNLSHGALVTAGDQSLTQFIDSCFSLDCLWEGVNGVWYFGLENVNNYMKTQRRICFEDTGLVLQMWACRWKGYSGLQNPRTTMSILSKLIYSKKAKYSEKVDIKFRQKLTSNQNRSLLT